MSDGQRILKLVETPSQDANQRYLQVFLLHQEASRHSPRTIQSYRETLKPFIAFLSQQGIANPQNITPDAIRRFLVRLERRGLASATVHKHARSIKAWLRFLEREEVIDVSPMRKVSMPKQDQQVPNPFAAEDIEALLKACDGTFALRDKAIILSLLDSGLRASEFISLKVGCMDEAGMIKITGKGRRQRYVRLGARARKAILRYVADRGAKDGEPLWVGRQGPLTVSGLAKLLGRLGDRAGVRPVNPHRFRKTFGTWCAATGMDAHSLRHLLGHSGLEVARRYVELAKADIEEAHKRASPVDRFLGKKGRKQ